MANRVAPEERGNAVQYAYRLAVESHMGSVGAPIAARLATIAPVSD